MKKILALVFMAVVISLKMAAQSSNVAYQSQQVRFTVLTDGVIRLEWQKNGHFTDSQSFIAVCRNSQKTDFQVKQTNKYVTITTSKMRLTYKKGLGKLTADNLKIHSLDKNVPFVWKPGMEQKENLKGTYRTLDGYDGNRYYAWNYSDKEGRPMPLEDGLLARDGWTLIDDSEGLLFDGDVLKTDSTTSWPWVKERSDKEVQDWYFMAYGHDYKKALSDYTAFAGRIPMPPRYAFGYWWSRYWSYSDAEIRQLVQEFNNYHIPLDVLVVDMDWHWTEKGKGGWTGYSWNTRLFPEPAKFLSYLKTQNLQITLNLHPADGVFPFEDHYPELVQWLGRSPKNADTIRWQSSDKRFMTGWIEKMLRPLERDGVDFWWLDWQQGHFDSKVKNLSNTWWLNYCMFSDKQRNSLRRPMLYHRWGGLGNHRYQIGFSGDSYSTWESLDFQPYFNSTASNVLYGYWSHDLGGHMLVGNNAKFDTELYARWMQLGTYLPIMRSHSSKTSAIKKEPWNLGATLMPVVTEAIRQRYRLAPYIYSCARMAYETGVSLCRPLYYDSPEEAEAYRQRNEYMFGDDLLIAPITKPMKEELSTLNVWLPSGTTWYELPTGTLLEGGQSLNRHFFIDEYPVYVKAGSIIPTYGDVKNLSSNSEAVTFVVYPGSTHGEGTFYEDNGDDKDYDIHYATTHVTMQRSDTIQTIIIGRRKGKYHGMPTTRCYALQLLGVPIPLEINVDGKNTSFTYEGKNLSVHIDLPSLDPNKEHVIRLAYLTTSVQLNDGLVGRIKRVQKTMEKMKFRDAGINYVEGLGQLGSIAQSLEYFPSSFDSLIKNFADSYQNLPDLLKKQEMKETDKEWFLHHVDWQ